MNRRRFMAAMGLSASSLLLPSLGSRAAGTPDAPLRLLIFYTLHGLVPDAWQMRFGGLPEDADWEADLTTVDESDFSDILRPLYPWRSRLLVADGLGMVSAEVDVPGLSHECGRIHSLTGAPMSLVEGYPFASAPSVDQVIADVVARSDRFRSLELGLGISPDSTADFSVVYLDALQQLPYEMDPRKVHQRLFGFGGEVSGAEHVRSREASILDIVADQYAALEPRLSGDDREKIALHRDLVRDLETRLGGLQSVLCETEVPLPNVGLDYAGTFDAQAALIQAAFSCDLTRVVTLQAAQIPNELVQASPGDLHADYAHYYQTDPVSHGIMTRYGAYHAEQFGQLLAALDAVPEGDGTLLDHTLVAWVGELGDGVHRFDGWPVVIAGGPSFRLGRYLRWAPTTPIQPWSGGAEPPPVMGLPHQHLLVSLAQAMGVDIHQIGTTEVEGTWGDLIDCTGPLDRLV